MIYINSFHFSFIIVTCYFFFSIIVACLFFFLIVAACLLRHYASVISGYTLYVSLRRRFPTSSVFTYPSFFCRFAAGSSGSTEQSFMSESSRASSFIKNECKVWLNYMQAMHTQMHNTHINLHIHINISTALTIMKYSFKRAKAFKI